ncbi:MAG: GDYXXLXY domain-containing protein [Rhizobiaceae bacterium]|nr:GDYXXLXY domain-containing protein [Rhizobiaceae bacterium]
MSTPVSSGSARRIWIAAVVVAGLQTLIFGYTVVARASVLWSGTDILLKVRPVDPTDLLRGDYVTLNYDISNVLASTLREHQQASDVGNTGAGSANSSSSSTQPQPPANTSGLGVLSVRLKKQQDGFWSVVESSFGTLAIEPDTVVLKSVPMQYTLPTGSDQTIWGVQYGIERYYVPEGDGRDLEQARNEGHLSVAVRVASDGKAQIRALLLDGKPIFEEPLY